MRDLIGTLDPGHGVARGSVLWPPDEMPLWLAGVDVGLSEARETSGGERTPFDAVGAYGWTRRDALTRAVGEAVERFSLIAPPHDPLVGGPADPDTLRSLVASGILGPDHPALDEIAWGRATELTAQGCASVGIPVALMTDPLASSSWTDASPSGAAAGFGREFAIERALRESVERDASICCWMLRPSLPFADSLELADRLGSVPGSTLIDVSRYLERHRGTARTVVLPTDVPGMTSAVTFIVGKEGGTPVLATGARASTRPAESVEVSLREAVQVYASLVNLLGMTPAGGGAEPVTDEQARARACMQQSAVDHLEGWIAKAGLVGARLLNLGDRHQPEYSATGLAAALRDTGLRPVVADLTARLPRALRHQGWASVRAIILGHQPYRMNDERPWSWCAGRLQCWADALPDVDRALDLTALSHTLI